MNYNKIKLYWKTLLLRRGTSIDIYPSFKCNFNCSYCALKMPDDIYLKSKYEMTLDEWKVFINNFPVKIKEVCITGGEPGLWPDIAELTNWLLDKGYHVKIFTNLSHIRRFMTITPSYRFMFSATYHKESNHYPYFNRNYKRIRDKYRIDVYEFGIRILPYSMSHKMFYNVNDFPQTGFKISPDGQIYNGCPAIVEYKFK